MNFQKTDTARVKYKSGKYCELADYEIENLSDLERWCKEVHSRQVEWNLAWNVHGKSQPSDAWYVSPAVLFRGEHALEEGGKAKNLLAKFNPSWVTKRDGGDVLRFEREILNEFKKSASSELDTHMGDWDMLALAQHYGLHTRYIDWTLDPLIALWFAVSSKRKSKIDNRESILFAIRTVRRDFELSGETNERPYPDMLKHIGETKIFKPSTVSP